VKRIKEPAMGAEEFRAILTRLGWTYHDASAELGISHSTVASYGGIHSRIPIPIAKLLRLLCPQDSEAFTLRIETGNDAFRLGADPVASIATILRELANRLEHYGHTDGGLFDTNGNRVGQFHLTTYE